MSRVYSTRELADLCSVNESTIKRWADSGRLTCIKTPGGHRKFKMQDVVIFLQQHGFDAAPIHAVDGRGVELSPDLDIAIRNGDSGRVAEIYVRATLKDGQMAARAILMRLLSAGQSPVDICDRVVAPALGIVGEHWVNGTLSILEEHIISASTLDGLSMLTDKMPRGERRPHRALCAPYEGDVHDIGARMTALALESIGWSAAASGYCAPLEEVGSYVEKHRPDLVCLSMTYAPTDQDRRGAFEKLREICRISGAQVALGGRGAAGHGEMSCDFRGTSLAGLVAWVSGAGLDAPLSAAARSAHAGTN